MGMVVSSQACRQASLLALNSTYAVWEFRLTVRADMEVPGRGGMCTGSDAGCGASPSWLGKVQTSLVTTQVVTLKW